MRLVYSTLKKLSKKDIADDATLLLLKSKSEIP